MPSAYAWVVDALISARDAARQERDELQRQLETQNHSLSEIEQEMEEIRKRTAATDQRSLTVKNDADERVREILWYAEQRVKAVRVEAGKQVADVEAALAEMRERAERAEQFIGQIGHSARTFGAPEALDEEGSAAVAPTMDI